MNRNTTIHRIMLIFSNYCSIQEQYYNIFLNFVPTKKPKRVMYTKSETKNEKVTINQKKVESTTKKPMPSIWYT